MFSPNTKNYRAVVIGGSGGVGRSLVEQLAKTGAEVLAVASDIRDLKALQLDCMLRYGSSIHVKATDLSAKNFNAEAFTNECAKTLKSVTNIFFTVGAISTNDKGVPDAEIIDELGTINYIRPAQLISTFCGHFLQNENGVGNIMVFTSIATTAPRGNNVSYAAAKSSLEFYCLGLQHFFSSSNIKIQVCSLGYVDTTMSFGLNLLFPKVSPQAVATYSLKIGSSKKRYVYYPQFWWLITKIIKIIPWYYYKKINF
jgi:short-subunit dehydrogenase